MCSDKKTSNIFSVLSRLLLYGFVIILHGSITGCAGPASTTQKDAGQPNLGKALHTMSMLNVAPLPIHHISRPPTYP